MVERQIVDLVVVGSNPITHPFTFMLDAQTFINQSVLGITENAPVAQLDRATDFESVGRTFEPCQAHIFYLISLITMYTVPFHSSSLFG